VYKDFLHAVVINFLLGFVSHFHFICAAVMNMDKMLCITLCHIVWLFVSGESHCSK